MLRNLLRLIIFYNYNVNIKKIKKTVQMKINVYIGNES